MRRALLTAVVTLSAASFACGKAAPLSDQDKAAIQKLHDDYTQAWNAQKPDIPAMVKASYTDEAKVLVPNFPAFQGTEAISKAFSSVPVRNFKFGPLEIDGRGDVAYVHGSYEGDSATPTGELAHEKGKFVDVLKKQADGSWKIVYDIWNGDAAPPALSVPTGTLAASASPEVKSLEWLVGTWQVNVDVKDTPLGPKGKQAVAVECRWFVTGQHVACTSVGTVPAGPYHELWVVSPDAATKAYKGYDVDDAGLADPFVLTFKDNAWTFDYNLKVGGKPLKMRTIFADVNKGVVSVKQEFSTGGAWTLAGEGTARKITG